MGGAYLFLHTTRWVLDSRSATAPFARGAGCNLRSPKCHAFISPVICNISPLYGRCDEDLMGQVLRLWNCLQAAATESQPRYMD
jgi:hypothetical protein